MFLFLIFGSARTTPSDYEKNSMTGLYKANPAEKEKFAGLREKLVPSKLKHKHYLAYAKEFICRAEELRLLLPLEAMACTKFKLIKSKLFEFEYLVGFAKEACPRQAPWRFGFVK